MSSHVKELAEIIPSWKEVVILPHTRPDGDAMGSSLALWHFFKARGINATVIAPTYYPTFLHWLPGNDKVWQFFQKQGETASKIKSADAVFCLDFNDLSRIDRMGQIVSEHAKLVVNIDHHLHPKNFANYVLHDVKASSTCELIYEFIEHVGQLSEITEEIATCIYTGIFTDTGGFNHSNTSAHTHSITADLMEKGVVISDVHENILENSSLNRLQFLGHCLSKCLKVYPFLNAALIVVSKEDAEHFQLEGGDTEGLVNYPLTIKGIKMSCLIKEESDIIKMSFRSKRGFAVNELASEHFNGGGHAQAAGGRSDVNLEKTIKKFEQVLNLHKEALSAK